MTSPPTPLRRGEGSKKLNFSLPLSDAERGAKSSIFRCSSLSRRGEQKAQFFVAPPFPGEGSKKLNFSLLLPFRKRGAKSSIFRCSSLSETEEQKAQFFVAPPFPKRKGRLSGRGSSNSLRNGKGGCPGEVHRTHVETEREAVRERFIELTSCYDSLSALVNFFGLNS